MSYASGIGIDIGITHSRAAIIQDDKIVLIPNKLGETKTPSYVSFTKNEILIGEPAKKQINNNLENTIFGAKRFIQQEIYEKEITEYKKYCPFKIIENEDSKCQFIINNKNKEEKYFPEEILTMIIKQLLLDTTNFVGKEIKDATITVPSYFNYNQINAIKDALSNAGIQNNRIIFSSSAVGLAYAYKKAKREENILVFDLGGSCLNLSLLKLEDDILEEIGIIGISNLGGENFDERLVQFCIKEFKREKSKDIESNSKALRRLFKFCEKAKKELSISTETTIFIDDLID